MRKYLLLFVLIVALGGSTSRLSGQIPNRQTPFETFTPDGIPFVVADSTFLPAGQRKRPTLSFESDAAKNEYYTWQIGLCAVKTDLKNIRLSFSDFNSGRNKVYDFE